MRIINILFLILLIPSASAITIDNPSQTVEVTNVTINFSSNQTYDSISLNTNNIKLSGYAFQVVPTSPLNITIHTWNTTDDYFKNITVSSPISNNPTTFTLSPFTPNTLYRIQKDGINWNIYTSNSSGYITFTYADFTSPTRFNSEPYTEQHGSGWSGGGNGNSNTPSHPPSGGGKNKSISNYYDDVVNFASPYIEQAKEYLYQTKPADLVMYVLIFSGFIMFLMLSSKSLR